MDQLFFVASKLFWMMAQPASWLLFGCLAALIALWRDRRRAATGIILSLSLVHVALAALPLGDLLLAPLERHFPGQAASAGTPDVIVVLGGAELSEQTLAAGTPQVNDAGDRLLAALALAHAQPQALILLSGGSGRLQGSALGSADIAGRALIAAGVDPARIIEENTSRNTAENTALAASALTARTGLPHDGAKVALVTSAFHMPRSLGAFCAAGWRNITPHPTDYRAGQTLFRWGWSFETNLSALSTALREWIGLAAYRLTGRTTAFLPNTC